MSPSPLGGRPPSMGWQPARHTRLPLIPPPRSRVRLRKSSAQSLDRAAKMVISMIGTQLISPFSPTSASGLSTPPTFSRWRWLSARSEPLLTRPRPLLRSPSPYASTRFTYLHTACFHTVLALYFSLHVSTLVKEITTMHELPKYDK